MDARRSDDDRGNDDGKVTLCSSTGGDAVVPDRLISMLVHADGECESLLLSLIKRAVTDERLDRWRNLLTSTVSLVRPTLGRVGGDTRMRSMGMSSPRVRETFLSCRIRASACDGGLKSSEQEDDVDERVDDVWKSSVDDIAMSSPGAT